MESKNLSSLIRLSVSDGQKTDSSIDVSFIQAIGGCTYATVFFEQKMAENEDKNTHRLENNGYDSLNNKIGFSYLNTSQY